MECVILGTETLQSEKKAVPQVKMKSVVLSSISHKKFSCTSQHSGKSAVFAFQIITSCIVKLCVCAS